MTAKLFVNYTLTLPDTLPVCGTDLTLHPKADGGFAYEGKVSGREVSVKVCENGYVSGWLDGDMVAQGILAPDDDNLVAITDTAALIGEFIKEESE